MTDIPSSDDPNTPASPASTPQPGGQIAGAAPAAQGPPTASPPPSPHGAPPVHMAPPAPAAFAAMMAPK